MDGMTMLLTKLVRYDVPSGSQIRMEMYAKSDEHYASYSFSQDTTAAIESQFDLIMIDSSDLNNNKIERNEARRRISSIGKIDFAYAITNVTDVKAFSPRSILSKANLEFRKGSADVFYLSLRSNPGTDDEFVCTWKIKGSIDSGYFSSQIKGKIVRIDGRPDFLIDL